MKLHRSLALTLLSVCAASLQPAMAATPDADQILRTMSATLSAAPSLSFKAPREIDAALLEDRQLPEKARIQVTVQRPDKFTATAHSARGTRLIVADGHTLSILDGASNHYTTTPMPMSIDALVDQLDDKYGFTPPLAEFAVSNPYARFRSHARTVTYLGRGKSKGGFLGLGGVDCHRLQLTGPVATAELWVSIRDHLPRGPVFIHCLLGLGRSAHIAAAWLLASGQCKDADEAVAAIRALDPGVVLNADSFRC